jgi:general secretion pathway protein I
MTRCTSGPGDCRGFSLLEVVVAFAILAVALGVLYQIFSGAAQRASLLQDYNYALSLAESKLARIGTAEPLVAGRLSGEFNADYRWASAIEPLDAKRTDANTRLPPFYQVTVTVARTQTEHIPLVSLTTVRMGVAP